MKIHRRISENSKYLTKLEKELLQLLLENSALFKYDNFTIANISEKFSISNTSVHRLSKKLGYKSFIQFGLYDINEFPCCMVNIDTKRIYKNNYASKYYHAVLQCGSIYP